MAIDTLLDPAVRHDAVFLFDVTDGNPNGDPDAGNRPRVDDETSQGLVTDVALKRKVRDTIGLAAASLGLDLARYQVFVEAGHALNTRLEESYAANGLPADGKAASEPKEMKKITASQAEPARRWLTERYVDIRLFGAVMSTGNTPGLGQIRGPLQFGMARSIDPVYPVDHAITRVTQTTQADIDKGERTEMGGKWTLPYALYRVSLHYSGERGRQTGVTGDDLRLVLTTMLNMFDHDRSATRGIMSARGLYVFSHSNAFGDAPAQSLVERVSVERIGDGVPRSFDDYKVVVDEAGLPAGVTLSRMLG
jgi:CRISPR-associated protein Csd2